MTIATAPSRSPIAIERGGVRTAVVRDLTPDRAGRREHDADERRTVFQYDHEHVRILTGPNGFAQRTVRIRSPQLAHGKPQRRAVRDERERQHAVAEQRVRGRFRMREAVHALDDRRTAAQGEDHTGHDDRPKVHLRAVPERVRRVGGARGAPVADDQQRLVDGVHE
jgi:hypothetical protein